MLRRIGLVLAMAALVHPLSALAQDDPLEGASDTNTLFSGAIMLEGEKDISLVGVYPGNTGTTNDFRYAYFVGNTLYAGVEDGEGNATDLIAEFFWFESSLDRGSDFYVGVFKVRTTPALSSGWRLEHDGGPALYLDAGTDLSEGTGSFRWDWSIPLDNYGIDAYGDIMMETSYGIGDVSEASMLAASEDGVNYQNIQSQGLLDFAYRVRSIYQITLWRWEVFVSGSANSMEWEMFLNRSDRAKQNGYHEFFLVMQTEPNVPFRINYLEFGGHARDPVPLWWDNLESFSGTVTDIVLHRPTNLPPPSPPSPEQDDAETQQKTPVLIDVLANDDLGEETERGITVTIVEPPATGRAVVNEDLTVTYTPDDGFFGTDTFVYELSNGSPSIAPVNVNVLLGGGFASTPGLESRGCQLRGLSEPFEHRAFPALVGLLLAAALVSLVSWRSRKRSPLQAAIPAAAPESRRT